MKVSLTLLSMIIFLGLTIPTSAFSQASPTNDQYDSATVVTPSPLLPVDDLISRMSPEEKIGQLFMIGILESKITPSLRERVRNIRPGFLILFRKNIITPIQTSNLIYNLQNLSIKNSKVQMIVAVDQEGGDVVRIPTRPSLPTAMALGRSYDLKNTFNIGKYVGGVLSTLGIHMNLAPVLDLSDPEKMSFIQTRSFGGNPVDVAKVSNQFARGVQSAGVISTAKHFPGLGPLKGDSHKGIVQNNVSREEFFSKYLKPYEELTREKSISAVMMTHLVYPALDPTLKPATFSAPIINILRQNLNFTGLIITDDIEMAGAQFYKTPEERSVNAFLAGNDVMMVAWNKTSQLRAYRGLLAAYKDGIISDERLNASLKKILNLKISMNLEALPEKPQPKVILAKLRDNSLKQPVDSIFEKIMNQELGLLSAKISSTDLKNVAIVSADYLFYRKFKSTYRHYSKFVPITKGFSFGTLAPSLKRASLIIVNVSGPVSALIANSLPEQLKKRSIILNSRYLGSIKNEYQFLDVLQLSMKHSDVGSYLGSYLDSHSTIASPDLTRNVSSAKEASQE